MTYSLEVHIAELRAELAVCVDWDECLHIEAELAGAMQELAYVRQELDAEIAKHGGLVPEVGATVLM